MQTEFDVSAESISAMKQAQISEKVGIRVLKMANDQQKSVLSLLDGAMESAARVQEAGKGEQVDVAG